MRDRGVRRGGPGSGPGGEEGCVEHVLELGVVAEGDPVCDAHEEVHKVPHHGRLLGDPAARDEGDEGEEQVCQGCARDSLASALAGDDVAEEGHEPGQRLACAHVLLEELCDLDAVGLDVLLDVAPAQHDVVALHVHDVRLRAAAGDLHRHALAVVLVHARHKLHKVRVVPGDEPDVRREQRERRLERLDDLHLPPAACHLLGAAPVPDRGQLPDQLLGVHAELLCQDNVLVHLALLDVLRQQLPRNENPLLGRQRNVVDHALLLAPCCPCVCGCGRICCGGGGGGGDGGLCCVEEGRVEPLRLCEGSLLCSLCTENPVSVPCDEGTEVVLDGLVRCKVAVDQAPQERIDLVSGVGGQGGCHGG